jgi:hypothetical protein
MNCFLNCMAAAHVFIIPSTVIAAVVIVLASGLNPASVFAIAVVYGILFAIAVGICLTRCRRR